MYKTRIDLDTWKTIIGFFFINIQIEEYSLLDGGDSGLRKAVAFDVASVRIQSWPPVLTAAQGGVRTGNKACIHLRPMGQTGSVMHFKTEKHTTLS